MRSTRRRRASIRPQRLDLRYGLLRDRTPPLRVLLHQFPSARDSQLVRQSLVHELGQVPAALGRQPLRLCEDGLIERNRALLDGHGRNATTVGNANQTLFQTSKPRLFSRFWASALRRKNSPVQISPPIAISTTPPTPMTAP